MFKAVDLIWKDEVFTIAPNKVLGAIAIIEEHYTFEDLALATKKKHLPLVGLSRVYGDVLRYAGATITDDDVYIGMFGGNMALNVVTAVNNLLSMMIPPSVLAAAMENGATDPKHGAGGAARGNVKSSKRPIKRSSVAAK